MAQLELHCSTGAIPLINGGNSDALLALVKAGAEISQQDKDGLSALHCASSRGHYKCAEILIMICGADVHQVDTSGCTPLFYATALGHPDCVRLLIESGGDVDHQDHKGRTAAHCGASKGQLETLKILHQHGANLWLKNVRGDLPLHEAIKSGRKDLVKWLLDQNPKAINEVNLYGRSALHIAAFNNNVDLCRLLVERGADVNSVMKVRSQYLTPLDAAHQNASQEVANYLAGQGAQPIAQIDEHLAEYLQTSSPIKELGARMRRQTGQVEGQEEEEDQVPSDETTTKLPNLIGGQQQHQHQRAHSRTALSTASSSTMENGGGGRANSTAPNKLHNCREFEHKLALERPTQLKQAIITNVYLTTAAVPTGTVAAAPVYYVKRVPPLKKTHQMKKATSSTGKRRSGGTNSGAHDSRSRSRSKDQMANGSGAGSRNGDEANEHLGGATQAATSVILETHDTYESELETRDERMTIEQMLTTAEEEEEVVVAEEKVEAGRKQSSGGGGTKGRDKRSISSGEQEEKEGDEEAKTAEQEEEEEVVEPMRTQQDDSGFETEAKVEATVEQTAEEVTTRKETVEEEEEEEATGLLERAKLTTQKVVEEAKELAEGTATAVEDGAEKVLGALGLAGEEVARQDDEQKDSIVRDFVQNVEEEEEDKEKVAAAAEDEEENDPRKRSVAEAEEDQVTQVTEEQSERQLSKADSIGSVKSTASAKSAGAASEGGRSGGSSGREDSAKSGQADGGEDGEVDAEEDEEEGDEEAPEVEVERATTADAEEDRSVMGDMVEGDAEEVATPDKTAEEEAEETRPAESKRQRDKEANEPRRESKPLEAIDEMSFEGSTPDVRKGSLEVVQAEVHCPPEEEEEGGEKAAMPEEVEEEAIVARKIEVADDDDGLYGRVEEEAVEDEEATEEPESRKQSSDVGGDVVADATREDAADEVPQEVADEEDRRNSLKPVVVEQRRKRSVSYDTAAEMSLVREPKHEAESDLAKVTPEEQQHQQEDSSTRKLSRSTNVTEDDETERRTEQVNRLELPGDDDDAASDAATFVQESSRRVGGKSVKYKTSKKYEHIGPKVDSYWNYAEQSGAGRRVGKAAGARGSREMVAGGTSAEEQYARINPKIINQTVEKYLRKYYLERKLFEELYDLKRFQIRTGKSNEPQAVKRLVEKFRRDIRAPGMADFNGPYSYRAYEMFLYDQLRKLSRSNERKIAFMDKSISYEQLSSSFDKSDYDSSSPTRGAKAQRATASKEDPQLDYDEQSPYGLSVDYKYEYHKSQHLDQAGKELVDVICENLYKRTGLNGNKVDEVEISRKVVERKKDETEQEEAEATESTAPDPPSHSQVSKLVRASPLSGPPLSSFFRRPKPKRPPMVIPAPRRIEIPHRVIEQRWAPIKRRNRRHRPTSEPAVSLWFELNKRP